MQGTMELWGHLINPQKEGSKYFYWQMGFLDSYQILRYAFVRKRKLSYLNMSLKDRFKTLPEEVILSSGKMSNAVKAELNLSHLFRQSDTRLHVCDTCFKETSVKPEFLLSVMTLTCLKNGLVISHPQLRSFLKRLSIRNSQ